MTATSRCDLPLLAAGQAQKELTHNEALALLDLIVQSGVESADLSDPPGSPMPGQCWIVADDATGAWAGQERALAGWTEAGWLFAMPGEGWQAWVADRGHPVRFDGAAWQDTPARGDGYYIGGERVVAARQTAIADPDGGGAPDPQAREAITAILAALRAHGLIAS